MKYIYAIYSDDNDNLLNVFETAIKMREFYGFSLTWVYNSFKEAKKEGRDFITYHVVGPECKPRIKYYIYRYIDDENDCSDLDMEHFARWKEANNHHEERCNTD